MDNDIHIEFARSSILEQQENSALKVKGGAPFEDVDEKQSENVFEQHDEVIELDSEDDAEPSSNEPTGTYVDDDSFNSIWGKDIKEVVGDDVPITEVLLLEGSEEELRNVELIKGLLNLPFNAGIPQPTTVLNTEVVDDLLPINNKKKVRAQARPWVV